MIRNVNGEDKAEAFEDALGPQDARATEELVMPGGEEALQEFRNYCDVEKLTKDRIGFRLASAGNARDLHPA